MAAEVSHKGEPKSPMRLRSSSKTDKGQQGQLNGKMEDNQNKQISEETNMEVLSMEKIWKAVQEIQTDIASISREAKTVTGISKTSGRNSDIAKNRVK